MLKQQARLFTKLSILLDATVLVVAFFATYLLLQTLFHRLKFLNDYAWVLLYVIPIWLLLLSYTGIYSSMRIRKTGEIFWDLLKVHLAGGIMLTSVIFLVKPPDFSRRFVATFVFVSLVLMTITKSVVKLILHYYRRKGYNTRNVLIIGNGEKASYFNSLVRTHAHWGLVVIGYFPFGEDYEPIPDCANLGKIDSLPDFCRYKSIDEVVISLPPHEMHLVDDQIFLLQEMGITVRMIIDIFDIPTARKELTLFHDELPILTFHSKAFDAEQLFLKRCLDICGSLAGLFITGLLLPFIALAIRLESKGPLFFSQDRVGQNGRIFKCWKLRSMYADAEQRKQELMALNEMTGAMFKIRDDPRVTRVGAFIRKMSIDELPQFWNVLRGEMSLVGTRPPTPDEVASYENWQRKRICIKPGITGLWQVSGRNQIQDFNEVVKLDIRYIEEWSIWLDIRLLAKTVWVVLIRQGAS
ncbi:MAG: sugar transferase [Desulfuromonadaceae bacterium]|nr:sugar transferase [Desulfuromonadaceae bacterium]